MLTSAYVGYFPPRGKSNRNKLQSALFFYVKTRQKQLSILTCDHSHGSIRNKSFSSVSEFWQALHQVFGSVDPQGLFCVDDQMSPQEPYMFPDYTDEMLRSLITRVSSCY